MADLSELLIEISADAPAGENLEYDGSRIALDTNIQGTPENQFTGEAAQPPNWRDILKESQALLRKSKDLQVLLYLIRSLIPLEGIKGFRDGLSLLDQLLNLYWDSLHPQLDPDDNLDPTFRVNILEELVNPELILQPLSLEMIVESKTVGRFSLRDIHYAIDKLPTPEAITKPEINTIRAAFLDVDENALNEMHQAIIDSLNLTDSIESFVGYQVGSSNGPNLESLKSLLKDLRYQFEQLAGSRLAGEVDLDSSEGDMAAGDGFTGQTGNSQAYVPGKITSRHEVIKALDSICKYYSEYEPSSPVPMLLERAKYLATADFMTVIKNMLPDALAQLEIIKGPDPNASSDY